MLSTYKKRIIKELGKVPEEQMPKLYKVIHQITTEFISGAKKPVKRGSLKGLWKGSSIEDSLFFDARKTLFPYESR
ncbi:MAG: hypothetical protein QG591_936 [Planctomycetota bacterium]|jgi:hypothetical protein|nr:hypothetical protein [Planctomycetota bacterium]